MQVQPDPSVQPVQEGVQYHPSIKFCAFDVAWMKQGADGELEQSYADFAQMQQWSRISSTADVFRKDPGHLRPCTATLLEPRRGSQNTAVF